MKLIKYRPTKRHSNADVLSRFPLPEVKDECSLEIDEMMPNQVSSVFSLYMTEDKPMLNVELMSRFTKKDPCLAKISYYVSEGWPAKDHQGGQSSESSEFKAFNQRRTELNIEDGCLLWGNRVVVPEKLRPDILRILHSTHMGMSSMKQLARNYVWWPKMDADIEFMVKRCAVCQANQRMPVKSMPHPWVRSQNPWERIHLDYAGPFKGSMWLLVIDSYSKWIEVYNMRNNIQATNTIRKLTILFSRYGLVKILVSDNAPQLTKSHEFSKYCASNGITHIPIPAYHASSNGQAESIVGKFKAAMRRMCQDNTDIELNIAKWLLSYHNTPHSATGTEPSVLMIGRRLRSPLSLVNPLSSGVRLKSLIREQTSRVESEKSLRRLSVGDRVLFRDVLGKSWKPGIVQEVSDKIYVIEAENGSIVRKHVDHVVKHHTEDPLVTEPSQKVIDQKVVGTNEEAVSGTNAALDVQVPPPIAQSTLPRLNDKPVTSPETHNSRPKRVSTQPDRWGYSKLGGD